LVALGNAARSDDVRCVPTRVGHAPPVVLQLRDALQQAEFVAQRCEELTRAGHAWSDLAVLARTRAELHDVARELSSRGVSARIRDDDDAEPPALDTTPTAPAITLSTVHRAKGLEWPVVFVIGLVEGRFPLWGSDRLPTTQDEEARLFHVAVTRARDELYLTHPAVDVTSGVRALTPSRFLRRLERPEAAAPPLLQRWDVEEAPRE
jgi:superfamily I DNA/RNA helicase